MNLTILHKAIWLCAAICVTGLCSGYAAAAPGDRLSVTVNRANVRSGPSTSHSVVMQLQQGSIVVERRRQDDWIEIESTDSGLKSGWIHAPLVKVETTAGQPVASNETAATDPLFELFMQAFAIYQKRVKSKTGRQYFDKVENPGNRVVQLTITDDWLNLTRPEQEEQLTEIFNIWDAAVGDGVPITVDIIDQDGTRLLSKFR